MLVRDAHRRLAGERQPAGQQLVRHDAERVQVRARVGRLAADLLGGQVLHRALDAARLRRLAVGIRAGQAEVGDLHRAAGRDQDVLGLDVAVDDALCVRGLEGEQRLADDLGRLRRLEPDVRVQQLARGAPADELHDHVVDAVDRAPVVDRDDVRVGEGRRRARLVAEPIDESLVSGEGSVQDLDRHLAREHGVVRAEDLAHPAGGDSLHDVIAAVERDESLASGLTGGLDVRSSLGRGEPPSGEAPGAEDSASVGDSTVGNRRNG